MNGRDVADTMSATSNSDLTTAYIGLGANLGDPQQTLHEAMDVIGKLPGIHSVRRSKLYSSAPVDAPGPFYVNAVVGVQTSLSADALLKSLQSVETDFGRERHYRNAPRTLDLDLLLYDQAIINEPHLVVPHPRMHLRAFVLRPLAELINPDRVVAGKPIRHWLIECASQNCSALD